MIAERLDGLEPNMVYEICTDTAEPLNTRFFGAFRLPPEDRTKLIDCLVLDSGDLLWTALHKLIPPTDSPKLRAVLRQYWRGSTDEYRVAALHILSRFGDESVLGITEQLLASPTRLNRVLAVACLRLLGTEDAWQILRQYWVHKNNPLDTRVQAAGDLLQRGEIESLPFLIETAEHDSTETSFYALMSIYHHHDKELGLKLMHGILTIQDHEAQDVTLQQVATMMRDESIRSRPDGLDAACEWLATQYDKR